MLGLYTIARFPRAVQEDETGANASLAQREGESIQVCDGGSVITVPNEDDGVAPHVHPVLEGVSGG